MLVDYKNFHDFQLDKVEPVKVVFFANVIRWFLLSTLPLSTAGMFNQEPQCHGTRTWVANPTSRSAYIIHR